MPYSHAQLLVGLVVFVSACGPSSVIKTPDSQPVSYAAAAVAPRQAPNASQMEPGLQAEPCTQRTCREGEGRLSNAFWRCEADAGTTQAHLACIEVERVRQDRAMQAALERLGRHRSLTELEASQARWRRAQLADCTYEALRLGDGRLADVVHMRCRLEAVVRRTIDLENMTVR